MNLLLQGIPIQSPVVATILIVTLRFVVFIETFSQLGINRKDTAVADMKLWQVEQVEL